MASALPKLGQRDPKSRATYFINEVTRRDLCVRAGTYAYTQMCAYAQLLILPVVRMHRGVCTLQCMLLLYFLHVFSLFACFFPLLPNHSCLIELKSLNKTCHGIKWHKSRIKMINLSTKMHVFTFRFKLERNHTSMLF